VKYYIIAGEASGDLYGAQLIDALSIVDKEASFYCWGGDLMAEKPNVFLRKHIRDLAFMGFVEVIQHLSAIKKNFSFAKQDIVETAPSVVILIDYPGFNLRMAKFLHRQHIPVFYYISPQVWAWKQKRVEQIRRYVDKMFVILPFEKDFYKKFNIDVVYEGHPLNDIIAEFKLTKKPDLETFTKTHHLEKKPIIALLPGSRKQEIKRKLPVMLETAKAFLETHQFVIAGAPSIDEDFYKQWNENSETPILFDKTYDLLSVADAALVTSGTATLETALFDCPQVVCYRSTAISYWLARHFIKVSYISLVNLIMNKPVVTELIQGACSPQQATDELKKLLFDAESRSMILNYYKELKQKLGEKGIVKRTVDKMIEILNTL
jgi:lipid-A-disaccharide synthase